MSGNHGWGGNDRADDFSPRQNDGFSQAHKPYSQQNYDPDRFSNASKQLNNRSVHMTAGPSVAQAALSQIAPAMSRLSPVDTNPRRKQVTTKKNVIIVSVDRTGSMGPWTKEILDRCAVLYKEAQKYLGEDLEILFTSFGDYPATRDEFLVAPLGHGPELDTYLKVLNADADGGGNGVESSDMAAMYCLEMLDTSSAQNVFFFTVTDEGFYPEKRHSEDYLGCKTSPELRDMIAVYRALKIRMNVFTIFGATATGRGYGNANKSWEETLGDDHVVPLDDGRRVVDVMLGVVAKITNQFDQFSVHLDMRQGGTQFGAVNQKTVFNALSRVAGAPQAPIVKAGTRSLMAAAIGSPGASKVVPLTAGGTKSLMANDKQ